MTVNQAVKTLRRRCGDTQQTFATESGISLRAYTKYEQEQMPEPRALVRFMVIAIETKNGDLFNVLQRRSGSNSMRLRVGRSKFC